MICISPGDAPWNEQGGARYLTVLATTLSRLDTSENAAYEPAR